MSFREAWKGKDIFVIISYLNLFIVCVSQEIKYFLVVDFNVWDYNFCGMVLLFGFPKDIHQR